MLRDVFTRGTPMDRSRCSVAPYVSDTVVCVTDAEMVLSVVITSLRPPPRSKSSCVNTAGMWLSLSPSNVPNENCCRPMPKANRPRPMVSARSARIGPKLCVDRTNVPVELSKE